jgi:hypothetical protein
VKSTKKITIIDFRLKVLGLKLCRNIDSTSFCPVGRWQAKAEKHKVDQFPLREEHIYLNKRVKHSYDDYDISWHLTLLHIFSLKVYFNTVCSGNFAELLNLEPIRTLRTQNQSEPRTLIVFIV